MVVQNSKKRNQKIFIIIIVVTIIVIVFHIPASWVYNESNSVCIHKRLFGIGCPLCGMTRAVYELVHLNFMKSIRENFNIIPFTLTLVCGMVYNLFPSPFTWKLSIFMLLLTAAGFILVYALRLSGLY